jgi:superfamily II DNA or RNA helicase
VARNHFKTMVVDEVHRGCSPAYKAVFGHFTAAKRLGITATPDWSDQRSLIYAEIAFEMELRELIERFTGQGILNG